MSKRNGFTLVELMVVIVIIGVLAAVAIPKMMAATNKAKASEGPQILGSIANMQHAYKAEYDSYIVCATSGTSKAADGGWLAIGFDQNPGSRYFDFDVAAGTGTGGIAATFLATAAQKATVSLGKATGESFTINEVDLRTAGTELAKLAPNWVPATVTP